MTRTLCIAGKNRIAIDCLNLAMAMGGLDIVAVCNRNDDGTDAWQPSLRKFCARVGVPVIDLADAYALDRMVFLSLEYDRIVRPSLFRPDARLYNIHFSALPAYKGVYTSSLPLLRGETESGCTLHVIDPGIDTGPIVDQIRFPLTHQETCGSLYTKYLGHAVALLERNLEAIVRGEVTATPQAIRGSSYFSRAAIDYGDLRIDLNQTLDGIDRQIRAFNFRAFQLPKVFDRAVTNVRPTGDATRAKPGTVLARSERSCVIATVDYDCELMFDSFDDLLTAARANDADMVRALLADSPALIDESDVNGWTPLIVAAFHGAVDCVALLLTLGADPNRGNVRGTTPLMYAKEQFLFTNSLEIFRIIRQAGADISRKDIFNRSLKDYVKSKEYTVLNSCI